MSRFRRVQLTDGVSRVPYFGLEWVAVWPGPLWPDEAELVSAIADCVAETGLAPTEIWVHPDGFTAYGIPVNPYCRRCEE